MTMFVGLLKTVTFVYDVVSFIPSYLLYQPHQRLKQSNRLKVRTNLRDYSNLAYRKFSEISAALGNSATIINLPNNYWGNSPTPDSSKDTLRQKSATK